MYTALLDEMRTNTIECPDVAAETAESTCKYPIYRGVPVKGLVVEIPRPYAAPLYTLTSTHV